LFSENAAKRQEAPGVKIAGSLSQNLTFSRHSSVPLQTAYTFKRAWRRKSVLLVNAP
jgi:hypothetical protein